MKKSNKGIWYLLMVSTMLFIVNSVPTYAYGESSNGSFSLVKYFVLIPFGGLLLGSLLQLIPIGLISVLTKKGLSKAVSITIIIIDAVILIILYELLITKFPEENAFFNMARGMIVIFAIINYKILRGSNDEGDIEEDEEGTIGFQEESYSDNQIQISYASDNMLEDAIGQAMEKQKGFLPENTGHQIKYCRKCGSLIFEGENFCKACGTEIIREEQP